MLENKEKFIIRKSKITKDDYTSYVIQHFDIQNSEETEIKIPLNFNECNTFNWNIGVIYGGSGTGKTTLLKEFGNITDINFDESKSLISCFDFTTPEEATLLLSSIGLSSVPTWLRPFNTLSNGEQYRANLAYKIGIAKENEVILVDEYTSVVDRDVAKAMSNALQKYIRKYNKKIVLASCHFDIMEWLRPDWTYSPLKGKVEKYDCRLSTKPRIELQVFRCRYETWDLFKQHHYLSHELNKAANCYLFVWNDKPVAFIAVLPFPNGNLRDAFRISRLVVLPDFQGLGIGMKILDYISKLYKKENRTMYIKTSNVSLFKGMERNTENWLLVHEQNDVEKVKKHNELKKIKGDTEFYKESITKSYKYIGEASNDDTSIVTFKSHVYKDVAQNQISLF